MVFYFSFSVFCMSSFISSLLSTNLRSLYCPQIYLQTLQVCFVNVRNLSIWTRSNCFCDKADPRSVFGRCCFQILLCFWLSASCHPLDKSQFLHAGFCVNFNPVYPDGPGGACSFFLGSKQLGRDLKHDFREVMLHRPNTHRGN